MGDVTVMRLDEMDSMMGGAVVRVRASLGGTAFGMQVFSLPPNSDFYPEHDHSDDGQEEVYTVLEGAATLRAGGSEYRMEPGTFARVGAGERRRFVTGDQPARMLAVGAMPGRAYVPPAFTERGAPEPQMREPATA